MSTARGLGEETANELQVCMQRWTAKMRRKRRRDKEMPWNCSPLSVTCSKKVQGGLDMADYARLNPKRMKSLTRVMCTEERNKHSGYGECTVASMQR